MPVNEFEQQKHRLEAYATFGRTLKLSFDEPLRTCTRSSRFAIGDRKLKTGAKIGELLGIQVAFGERCQALLKLTVGVSELSV